MPLKDGDPPELMLSLYQKIWREKGCDFKPWTPASL